MQILKRFWWFILLLGIAAIFIFSNRYKQRKQLAEKDFAVESLSSITSIGISNAGGMLTLERQNDGWLVNNSFIANNEAVEALFRVISRVTAESPVPLSVNDSLVNYALRYGLQLTIAFANKGDKCISLHSTETYNLGNIGVIKGSRTAYKLSLPQFKGKLTSLFRVDELYWKSNKILLPSLHEITSVEVEIPNDIVKSFRIDVSEDTVSLYSVYHGNFLRNFSADKVTRYLESLSSIEFEQIADTISALPSRVDYSIRIQGTNGDMHKIKVYPVPVQPYFDELGREVHYDPNSVYLTYQSSSTVFVTNYMDIYQILRDISFFTER